jgi:acetylornithine deacetylase/succinyl-diaminopimelate desuccinylase family protein
MRDHISMDSVVEMTRSLVVTDTRNPPGNERVAADVARGLLTPLGFSCSEIEPAPGRVSLIATRSAGVSGAPTLIVNGHIDVVPINPSGWSVDPFGGVIQDGRMWGRGTADMKGGIAAAIEAVKALDRAGIALPCDLVFHLVADEERGGKLGTAVLSANGQIAGDACLVPEPTSMAVCIAERGLSVVDVTLHGRPAHASEPSRGLSAIEKAAKVVLALHGASFGHPAHPLLGTPTANAGVIQGGSGHNTVAERCVVTIDHRLLPGQSGDDAVADVRRLIDGIGDPELIYETYLDTFGEASELAADHPWVSLVRSSIGSVLGGEPPIVGMTFATDARFVRNDAGIPAVVCGPGGIEQAHVDDEWVSIDALVDAAAAYATLMASFDKAFVTATTAASS